MPTIHHGQLHDQRYFLYRVVSLHRDGAVWELQLGLSPFQPYLLLTTSHASSGILGINISSYRKVQIN